MHKTIVLDMLGDWPDPNVKNRIRQKYLDRPFRTTGLGSGSDKNTLIDPSEKPDYDPDPTKIPWSTLPKNRIRIRIRHKYLDPSENWIQIRQKSVDPDLKLDFLLALQRGALQIFLIKSTHSFACHALVWHSSTN